MSHENFKPTNKEQWQSFLVLIRAFILYGLFFSLAHLAVLQIQHNMSGAHAFNFQIYGTLVISYFIVAIIIYFYYDKTERPFIEQLPDRTAKILQKQKKASKEERLFVYTTTFALNALIAPLMTKWQMKNIMEQTEIFAKFWQFGFGIFDHMIIFVTCMYLSSKIIRPK